MKQYTTLKQTAKLIELGFEKPKLTFTFKLIEHNDVKKDIDIPVSNYSIGELIEMLDKVGVTTYIRFGGARAISLSNNKGREMLGGQLIDLLFVMIVELKEEGVI